MAEKEISTKKIDCKEFSPIEEGGKKKCYYYVSGGGCTIPKNLCCIIAPPKIQPDIKRLSHSTVSSFIGCRRRVWLDRIKLVRPKVREPYFITGQGLHDLTAMFYDGDLSASFDSIRAMFEELKSEDPKLDAAKALVTISRYISYAGNNPLLQFPDPETEFIYDGSWNGYPIQYRYDIMGRDKTYFVEHKFTGINTLDLVSKIDNMKQIALGFILAPKAEKCVLNVIKKINLKFNPAKEDIQQFMNRSEEDIKKNPGKYFRQFVYERKEIDLNMEEAEFDAAANDLLNIPRTASAFYKNTGCAFSVVDCTYKPICETGVVSPEYYYVIPPNYKPKERKEEKR